MLISKSKKTGISKTGRLHPYQQINSTVILTAIITEPNSNQNNSNKKPFVIFLLYTSKMRAKLRYCRLTVSFSTSSVNKR